MSENSLKKCKMTPANANKTWLLFQEIHISFLLYQTNAMDVKTILFFNSHIASSFTPLPISCSQLYEWVQQKHMDGAWSQTDLHEYRYFIFSSHFSYICSLVSLSVLLELKWSVSKLPRHNIKHFNFNWLTSTIIIIFLSSIYFVSILTIKNR